MAKLYGNIASSALMTFDKSFARANGQPLDSTEVYYSLAAAEEYAAGAGAYIGQKIVVIENNKITHYSIEDADGTLKELGSKPVGDSKTVSVAADGKISLANIPETLKDEEGNDIPATYNAVLVNGVLTWVKPSATTVEGLSDLIEALTGRVDTAEGEIDALQSAVGVAAKPESSEGAGDAVAATGLFKAIADEIVRATGAETALGERIDAIDFVDEDELAEAIKDFATTEYVDGKFDAVEHPVLGVAAEDKILALGADKLISATVALSYDSDAKSIKLTGKDGADLGSVDATPFIKDGMLNDVEYNVENNTLTFTWNVVTGEDENGDPIYQKDEVILSDIIEPYTAGIGLELDGNEFAVKVADGNESFLTVDENGVKLSGVQTAINTAKGEAISDAEGKIATAKQEAIDAASTDATNKANQALADAKADAASLYATKEYVGTIPNGEDGNPKAANVVAYIEHKAAEVLSQATGGSSESAASVKGQLDTFKAEINPKVAKNTEDITTINEKLKDIEANADVNIIETVKVNGSALTPDENKAVDITVPTKFSEITDDSGFDGRITAAQTKANEAADAASGAQSTADEAKASASSNKTLIDGLTTTVEGHTTTIGDHGTRLTAAETTIGEHTGKIGTIEGQVALKADKSTLDALAETVGTNGGNITALTTRVAANETAIGTKANASEVYTKTEIDKITGTPTEGKTLVQMIADAQTAATYNDTQVKADIKANADAIAILNGVTAENTTGDAGKSVRAITVEEIAKVVNGAPESFDTLKEIADWINSDTTGAAKMNSDITDLKAIVAGIGGTDEPATVAALVEQEIAAIPLATLIRTTEGDVTTVTATKGLILPEDGKFEMTEGKVTAVSTDLLVNGTSTLVLNGGSAND